MTDRLGSVRKVSGGVARNYYPFGEEIIPQGGTNDTCKFASTCRDSITDLDCTFFAAAGPTDRGTLIGAARFW